jgi:phosphoglycerate dehydrogenase-like enzyme
MRIAVLSSIVGLRAAVSRSLLNINKHTQQVTLLEGEEEGTQWSRQKLEEAGASVILGDPDRLERVLDEGPLWSDLNWIACTFSGVDRLCSGQAVQQLQDAERLGMDVTRHVGLGPTISEYVIAHIISKERDFVGLMEAQRERRWSTTSAGPQAHHSYRTISEISVGIMGLGTIGTSVASALAAFGCKDVRGLSLSGGACPNVQMVWASDSMEHLLSPALDYLVNTLPSTSKTRGFLSREVLGKCGGATLINVGRGDVISLDDLQEALEQGHLGGAVLDVFELEPLPCASPLWGMPRVTITPHVAAKSGAEGVAYNFISNIKRRLSSKRLVGKVDVAREY